LVKVGCPVTYAHWTFSQQSQSLTIVAALNAQLVVELVEERAGDPYDPSISRHQAVLR